MANLANELKVLCGVSLNISNIFPSNKELSKLIRQEIKTCGGWKFFPKSKLKKDETIESYIISLNKKMLYHFFNEIILIFTIILVSLKYHI